jgi:hypothetical protein
MSSAAHRARKAAAAISVGLIALLCLAGALAGLFVLFQLRASPLPFLRSLLVQRQAQSQACEGPWHLVPGSYHADPAQTVGDWAVVTYTAECDAPGLPRQIVSGYNAMGGQGGGCAGWSGHSFNSPAVNGTVAFDNIERGACGNPGAPNGLSVITGLVSTPSAVSIEISFSNGATASGLIRNGRFVVTAPWASEACVVRTLDASGAVLVEDKLALSGSGSPLGTCP